MSCLLNTGLFKISTKTAMSSWGKSFMFGLHLKRKQNKGVKHHYCNGIGRQRLWLCAPSDLISAMWLCEWMLTRDCCIVGAWGSSSANYSSDSLSQHSHFDTMKLGSSLLVLYLYQVLCERVAEEMELSYLLSDEVMLSVGRRRADGPRLRGNQPVPLRRRHAHYTPIITT